MRLNFKGDLVGLEEGLSIVADEIGFEIAADGHPVQVVHHHENRIELKADGNEVTVLYAEKIHFFRAVGLLVESLRKKNEFSISETPQFKMNGPMFDVSQGNALMKVDSVKTFIRKMALMGLNMIMLYSEDSYEVKEQPYFGYMRSRYSPREIKLLDDYADLFGIELIPCIQTLSHLEDVLKWSAFADLRDDHETMLVGHDRTYEFIEQMIVAASAPVRSNRIHIGMDEAWKLGLGEYLVKNGLRSKFEIMNEHLNRVMEITNKHGLKPMIWSDMYFRAGSKTGDYYDQESAIPNKVIEGIPKGLQLVYWDYEHSNENFYIDWIQRHKEMGSTPLFAGGIWNWKGFVLNYGATFVNTNAALKACKSEDVKEVIATLWGNDGTECDWFSSLLGLQLFAEHGYSSELDTEKLKRRFHFCTGAHYEDFIDIKYVDETPGISPENLGTYNTSRCLLWQNIMMGLFDKNIQGWDLSRHYIEMENKMEVYAERNGEFNHVFEILRRLCSVLALKAEMGNRITDAYKKDSRAKLSKIAHTDLPELASRVKDLHVYHRERWHKVNKPFGWEVIELRYGALLLNIETAERRILDYLSGKIKHLGELEEERLPFHKEGLVDSFFYKFIPSASRIARD